MIIHPLFQGLINYDYPPPLPGFDKLCMPMNPFWQICQILIERLSLQVMVQFPHFVSQAVKAGCISQADEVV